MFCINRKQRKGIENNEVGEDFVSHRIARSDLSEEVILFFFFPFIFISWRLITLQYCSGFCHTLT